jgi:hypothetical protein
VCVFVPASVFFLCLCLCLCFYRDLTTPAQLHLEAKRTHKSLPIALDPNSNNLTITETHLEKTRKYLASLDNKTESADSADSADSNQRHKYMQTQVEACGWVGVVCVCVCVL